MGLTRVAEAPRVTKPFAEDVWTAMDRLGGEGGRRPRRPGRAAHHGRRADLRLGGRLRGAGVEHRGGRADQARLGRPTDPPPAREIRAGGLLHYGQGKWYPGESLPRWAFALYWRKGTGSPSGAIPP